MNSGQLKSLLRSLHDELEKQPKLDPENKALLEDIAKDILSLANGEQHAAAPEDLAHRLEDAIAIFEVSHPDLVTTIYKVLEGLSNAGI